MGALRRGESICVTDLDSPHPGTAKDPYSNSVLSNSPSDLDLASEEGLPSGRGHSILP